MLQSSNSGGIVSRVQGVNKYYTFEICKGNKLRIGKMNNDYKILKEEEFGVEFFKEYNLKMTVIKNKIIGHINDKVIIEVEDDSGLTRIITPMNPRTKPNTCLSVTFSPIHNRAIIIVLNAVVAFNIARIFESAPKLP